jgi:hypothetical protein
MAFVLPQWGSYGGYPEGVLIESNTKTNPASNQVSFRVTFWRFLLRVLSRVCLDKSSCSFFPLHQGERKEEFWRQNGRERFSRSLTWRRRFRPDACTPVWHHRCRVDKKRPPGFLSFRRLLDREIGEELQENAWIYL